jgi:hypothetical protein
LQAPRHLDQADQAFSDRAVAAANGASPERRIHAWQVVNATRGKLAPGDTDEAARLLETTCLYGAALLLMEEGEPLGDANVVRVAEQLREVHYRHTAAIAKRAKADNAVG